MIILYINNEHCTSVTQLKGYFSEDLTPESDIYADLLDYGRHGDIAAWLRELGETELASRIESIDTGLSDSAFYRQLKAAITGIEDNTGPIKPEFEKCFSFEGMKCNVKDNEAKIIVSLKILMCVNETYELTVSSNLGTSAELVNPSNYPEGQMACFVFTLKRPGMELEEITVMGDGKLLADEKVFSQYFEIVVGEVKFKMIHVEGGTFTMGPTREVMSDGFEKEKPAHQVMLSSFSIGETPVTQELWQAVMGDNPSYIKGAQLPVECVSWNDCQRFIRMLNQITNRQFRLPTEAEWEFAARGGLKTKGYEYSGSNVLNEVAWYNKNSSNGTHPVKGKKPNELGIYDMCGNVEEHCQDWYNWGGDNKTYRVRRGGSFDSAASNCRLTSREGKMPDCMHMSVGFRLSLSE